MTPSLRPGGDSFLGRRRHQHTRRQFLGRGYQLRQSLRRAVPGHLFSQKLASEGLLAFIATVKFCDALPLYRQERQFARVGVELSRRTMSDWMIAAAGACEPLLELLLEQLRSGPKLQIDETTVQVLQEPDRDYVRRPA